MKFAFSALLLSLALPPAWAQSGCPDPQATNYNPTATANDGSCQYPSTTIELPLKTRLAAEVAESSGLAYAGGKLWTINDSGNPALLFRLDSATGRVVQQVAVKNFANVDWEDVTATAQYLYVGDFGNNSGTRRNLRVLRIPQAALGPAADSVDAESIEFSYPDQTDFTSHPNQQNFDCEAFFFANDSLHLFTKNWGDFHTRYYTIPAQPGACVAHLKATFAVNGLITAASLNPAGNVAALLGYNASDGATFLWLLSGFQGTSYFAGNKRRLELPSALAVGQVEGLCFVDRSRVFISNEHLNIPIFPVPQQLYALNTRRWLAPTVLAARAAQSAGSFTVTPNPASHSVRIERTTAEAAHLTLLDLRGRVVLTRALPAGQRQAVTLPGVAPGEYVLRLRSARGTYSRKIQVL